jgi:hypothetical protein
MQKERVKTRYSVDMTAALHARMRKHLIRDDGQEDVLSHADHDTEADYERVARAYTKMPLVGMTLASGDEAWSARFWFDDTHPSWAESVRCVSAKLFVTWNDTVRPAPRPTPSQQRTVSAWGDQVQASIARLRVLVVGTGSVGLDVAQRLAATGLLEVGVMDFDAVESVNLDRMIGATRLDAAVGRAKVTVAARLMVSAATADRFTPVVYEMSVTDPAGLEPALDYGVIFCCVDRPWPRAVLNMTAYADLIPVIDGGIALDTFDDGRLRSGIWRSHTLVPDRPCMVCLGQLDLGELSLDKRGLFDDPTYIPARRHAGAVRSERRRLGGQRKCRAARAVCQPGCPPRRPAVSLRRCATFSHPISSSTPPRRLGSTAATNPKLLLQTIVQR